MTKLPIFTLGAAIFLLAIAPVFAGAYGAGGLGDISSVAEREVARRQEAIGRANDAIDAGDRAMDDKDYELAFASYRKAADLLPEASETAGLRRVALKGMCRSGVALAEKRASEGRFGDAEAILKLVLQNEYDPRCYDAKVMLAHLEDPDYYNKTVTPRFVAQINEVKKLLLEAEQYYQTGRYDLAMKRYDQVLNIDPYNIAARKGQEQVNRAKSNYAIDAYNETRSRAMWDLDKAWQSPVRKYGLEGGGPIEQRKLAIRTNEQILKKLDRIIIPQINFRDATIREAIEFLKQKSADLDTQEPDASKRGVNIVLKLEQPAGATPMPGAAEPAIPGLEPPSGAPSAAPAVIPEKRITLQLKNVPLREALRYITNLAGLKYKVDPYAVEIVPLSEPTDVLITKEYRVPPGFITNVPSAAAEPAGPFGAAPGTPPAKITQRGSALDFLKSQGVQFPPGASANFLPSSSRLIVRNTPENLELIDTLVDAAVGAAPSQVEIESKFVEITQSNLKELSFDWLLGAANVPGSNGVFYSGGTAGTGPGVAAADYPFAAGGVPVGANPITGGNRNGNFAISQNAIDALLFGVTGATNIAPAVFGVAGVFTDPQFQVVIRALNQKKGVDLLSAPRVTTKSGQRAVIEIIRELKYPVAFDPPQIPQAVGSGVAAVPVTPSTPSGFDTRNTGVTLEVEPQVGPDGYTIDLSLVPQVVEFEGFINYGSPIRTASVDVLGNLTQSGFTANVINQPVFSTRKVTTSVSVGDGQTVVLGGLMREDVQQVQDKTPLLGDLPLIGRAFRSNVDQHVKQNLIIFVTARLINPAGEPVLQQEEEEETVEPIAPPELAPPSGYAK